MSPPFAPVIPDYVTLALAETPPGVYDVTVEITDKSSGHSAARTTKIQIRR